MQHVMSPDCWCGPRVDRIYRDPYGQVGGLFVHLGGGSSNNWGKPVMQWGSFPIYDMSKPDGAKVRLHWYLSVDPLGV